MGHTPDSNDKAELILTAAQAHFTQLGYRRTSMDDIARGAGVAKGTLYLYFENKAAVFRAMQERNFREAEARCEAADRDGASFEERLSGTLTAYFGWIHDNYGLSEHLLELGQTRQSVGADLAERHDRAYARRLQALIERGVDEGELTLRRADLSVSQITEVIVDAARGAKNGASGPVTPARYNIALKRIARLAAASLAAV